MKRRLALLLVGCAMSLSAHADGFRHRDEYRPPRLIVERPHHHHHHHHRHSDRWLWGAAAGLALGSVVLSLATPKPPPVVVSPVVVAPPSPPAAYWYYCETYRAYYPTVQYCPSPWIAVPAY